jgi:hypothetical protein
MGRLFPQPGADDYREHIGILYIGYSYKVAVVFPYKVAVVFPTKWPWKTC